MNLCFFFVVILTQTVGQMTDSVASRSSATQTARPQTSLAFLGYRSTGKAGNNFSNDVDKRLLRNEEKLYQQVIELDAINEMLSV